MIYLDNGHGGMEGGKYLTAPKKMYCFGDKCIYEGEFNRQIVYRVMEHLDYMGIAYVVVCPEIRDVSLTTRTSRANKDWNDRGRPKSFFLSIHANGGRGEGSEIFTYFDDSPADVYADILISNMASLGKIRVDLIDGDKDKEANLHVIRETLMPAALLECAFMDNPLDFNKLRDPKWRDRCALIIAESLQTIHDEYLS